MEQVAEGLYRLGRKHHNFHLIVAGGRATVVDAGGSRELPLLRAALGKLDLALEAVEALCAGDALVTDGLIHSRSGPQLLPARFHLDAAAARSSLDRLTAVDADVVLPGHGPPWLGSLATPTARALAQPDS